MSGKGKTALVWVALLTAFGVLFLLRSDGSPSGVDWTRTLLTIGLPIALLLAFLVYFLRKAGAGGQNLLELRRSRARLLEQTAGVCFSDVGGCDEAKIVLGDLVAFLRDPERWVAAGARLPRGVLLEGPPGCGKTLLARAVAGETDASFYVVSASEFVEMFVGVGAARVRDMFETARKNAPAVLFIDELDAVGRRRGSGVGAAHDEREQTLNQLLVCLDGFEANERVVVVAATNRPDILDPALLRSGRFDRCVSVPTLALEGRLEVLGIHTAPKNLADDVSLKELAERTEGFSGAQIESLANEAALLAVRRAAQAAGETVCLAREDFLAALESMAHADRGFDKLDSVLIESTSQLSEPRGQANVRLDLDDGTRVEGRVIWADASFLKLCSADGRATVVPKRRIARLEAAQGTEVADDVQPDRWAGRGPDLA